MSGLSLIYAERQRQIEKEGWSAEHDDEHKRGELRIAGSCYASCFGEQTRIPPNWPWDEEWWKPRDRRSNLVRAGALYLAEHDRLLRIGGTVYITDGKPLNEWVRQIAKEIDELDKKEFAL